MIDQLWARWKEMRDSDPVKARLVRVLMIAATIVTPFLTAWVWKGFAYAMGMVTGLVVTGLGLLVVMALVNKFFGWTAHYVLTGVVPPFDDWLDNTILDEWENYQFHKAHVRKPKVVTVRTVDADILPPAQKLDITNLNEINWHSSPGPVPMPPASQEADGPEWLRKS